MVTFSRSCLLLEWPERNIRFFQSNITFVSSQNHSVIDVDQLSYKLMVVKSSNLIVEFKVTQLFDV